jgi:hypothetical protein
MSEATAKRRATTLRFAAALYAATLMTVCSDASAGQYTVGSCDSAAAFGHNSAAWARFANAGSTYESCPTNGGDTAGVSDRLTGGGTYTGFSHSGHYFTAPPGATITQLRWAGRMARQDCRWGIYFRALPSFSAILGAPPGQFCDTSGFDNRGWPLAFAIPPDTTRLEQLVVCGDAQCPAGATMHSHILEVTINDPVPPNVSLDGPLASGQWVSGTAGKFPEVRVSAADNAGVQRIDTTLAALVGSQGFPCDWSLPRPCAGEAPMKWAPGIADLADGEHQLQVSVIDAAGNTTHATRGVRIDNTPPDPVVPAIAGGTGWRQTNGFAASWTNPPNSGAPITRAHWKLCRPDGGCPSTGSHPAQDVHDLPLIHAPVPGEYQLAVWLEDAAGNQREANAALSVPLRWDPEPPELAFLAPDPADPLRVTVRASDRHSGVVDGEIEMRASGAGTWHALRTELEGAELVAYVDDERFRRGAFEFRARVLDRAGNEATSGKRTDGSAATVRLPLRIDTRLAVGLRRRSGRRLDADLVAAFGRRLRITGRLTNADGQPLDGASIEALEKRLDGTTLPVGLATTNEYGGFRYLLRATRNRELTFRYGGSRRIGAATARFRLRVPATSSIRVNRSKVRNGQGVLFRGRVLTRPVPANGKLIEMQAHFRGRWRTFATLRSDDRGAWKFRYRFGATLGRVTYRFRAQLPYEGGYPFVTGRSRVAKVVVLGP